ncbi:prefoldin subunit alpha [Candidatus Woesearchaeota archaeon B3_Woes]|nr:MAG: prefoldin subunit alpha [Candidatus Woesearchaeota archaeon B3_Woes]
MTEEKNKEKEAKAQELYMQLNTMNQQMVELQKQIQTMEETIFEVNESKKGLDDVSKSEKGKEILVPIISGIFAKAELKEPKEFIVNVGSNTAVVKSIEDVQKILDKQLTEMQKTQNTFVDSLTQLTVEAKKAEKGLKELIEK